MNDQSIATSNNHDEDEIDLLELLHTILAGKWKIFLYTVIGLLFAFIYAFGQDPIYKADALLQVEKEKSGIPGMPNIAGLGGGESSVGTELEILKSRKILGQTIKELRLNIYTKPKKISLFSNLYYKLFSSKENIRPTFNIKQIDNYLHQYAWSDEGIVVDRFDVPEGYTNKPYILKVKKDNQFDLYFEEKLQFSGEAGKSATSLDGATSIFVSSLSSTPNVQYNILKWSKLHSIENLKKRLSISEQGKRTGIIKLALTGDNKKRINQTLNLISAKYLKQNKSRSSEEARNAIQFLNEQITPIKEKADIAETKLKEYRINHQTADILMETKAVLETVSSIGTELRQLSLKKDNLGRKYTPNHPVIQAINSQIQKLTERKTKTFSQIEELPSTQQELLKLQRDFNVANSIYLEILNNLQEFKIAKASNVGNVYIVDRAETYDNAIKPKKGLILVLGLILGTMLGTLLVFLKKALHYTVNNPKRLEEVTGITVYSTVPLTKKVNSTSSFKKNKQQKSLLALKDPTDPAIESLRSLRTSLHFALLEAENNIVMITGPAPSIGKSFISSNFAAVLATGEKRVLLIDADMRKGYLHNLLEKGVSPGLSDLISDKATIEDSIHTIQVGENNFDIMTRGQTPPNPSELLMHSNFKKLLNQLSAQYDLVLIDTPPIHAVTDPTIIGRHSGVTFMVVRSDYHSMKEIEHAVERLKNNGVTTKGFIFNGYVAKKSGYGSYDYHSYYGEYK